MKRLLPRHGAVVAVLMTLASVDAGAQTYPRLGSYTGISGNGFPFIIGGRSGPLNAAAIDSLARFEHVILGANPVADFRPDLLTELRLRRPDIEILAYVMAQTIWDGPSEADSMVHYPTRMRRLVRDSDGYLYNKQNQRWTQLANINIAKKDAFGRFALAEAMVDLWNEVIIEPGLWDGMFFDVYCDGILWMQTPAESLNFQRAGYPNAAAFDAAWKQATEVMASRLRTYGGPEFQLVGNCAIGDKYAWFNGWMRENFPLQNGGTWEANMLNLPGGYFDQEARMRQPTANYLFTAASPSTPYDATAMRKVRFGLGSAALGTGYAVYAPNNLTTSVPFHTWWYDEYGVDVTTGASSWNLAHTGWLGEALGPYYQMVWVGTNPDACPNPDFETDVTTGWQLTNFVPASVTRDASTAASGSASARFNIPNRGGGEYSAYLTSTGRINVGVGQQVSATFWAKASAPCTMRVNVGLPAGVLQIAGAPVILGTTWKRHQVVMTAYGAGNVGLMLCCGFLSATDVWFDDVHMQLGASSVYRRDFQNGTVLLNPSASSLTIPLERQFRRIQGLRDPGVNNGAFVTQITVPSNDARFLIGTDVVPPAGVTDLRPASP